jgi:Adenylate and Guanylate cyclase catalytic domain
VAACGLPEPRKDHAIVMARFARDMHVKAHQVLQKLATADGGGLGPDTAHLCFRVGLHSGAVMGGVLRGDNARFQLFGDAMNTAARMEHTGLANRTHMSATTAELLIAAGKQNWITQREEKTIAKGLGELSTYWLHSMSNRASGSTADGQSQNNDQTSSGADDYTTGQMDADVISDIDENEGGAAEEQVLGEQASKTTTSSSGAFLDRPEYVTTCSTDTDVPSPSTTATD